MKYVDLKNLPRVAQTLDTTCGAACFESMYRFFKGQSPGEMHFARELGTLELGLTASERVCDLAVTLGFECELIENARPGAITSAVERGDVTFVTWWYEDSGHYSLVKEISSEEITLMDPWLAREDKDHVIPITEFLELWKMRGSRLILVRAREN